jgi:hypothetical protein
MKIPSITLARFALRKKIKKKVTFSTPANAQAHAALST